MKVAVRKLQIEDAAKLQMLVAENIDAVEPGLVVLDSRLLLGHATIDVVGLDGNGALVLIATGLTANEEMLLKAVEAYSWCREYPQSLERLYPSCIISDERPPRLIFVVERMPDAFHRKIKQLGFPEVDCVEFRLFDVEGAPTVYFESILRLRRPTVTPVAPRAETPADAPSSGENVIAMNGAVAARATSLKLQKLLNQAAAESPLVSSPRASERPAAPPREPAVVVSMVSRQPVASTPRVERPLPEPIPVRQPEPVIAAAPAVVREPEPIVVPEPIIVTPEPMIASPAPVIVAPTPVIATPEPILLPQAAAEPEPEPPSSAPDPELGAQMQRALAALELESTPKPTLVVQPEPVVAVEPEALVETVLVAEPARVVEPEIAAVPEIIAVPEMVADPELPTPASEPIVVAAEPEPVIAVPEPPTADDEAIVPPLNGVSTNGVPALKAEPVSLRGLPELSLRPSAPMTVPRPAPIPAPAPAAAAATPTAEPQEARVSFKDLAAALLGPTPAAAAQAAKAAPAGPRVSPTPKRIAVEPVVSEPIAEAPAEVVIEPVSPAMAVAELEPALTVEALIKSATPAATAAPVAPAAAAAAPAAGAPKAAAAPLPEFEGLKFPNDGVLTRQWMEFLSQMSTTK
ncbi:MAG TPA: hypothetical protein VGM22_24080 [Methylomirabilota bacterium]|jgi:hypothetical protein